MPEYIEREALIKRLEASPLIKNYLIMRDSQNLIDGIFDLIKRQPTADVIDVVRCMHCIHFKASVIKENYCDLHSSTWDKFYVRVDNFCSYGKRKEVVNNG